MMEVEAELVDKKAQEEYKSHNELLAAISKWVSKGGTWLLPANAIEALETFVGALYMARVMAMSHKNQPEITVNLRKDELSRWFATVGRRKES